ncbi:MAG: hypothetical protein AAFM92_03300 [Pseudomonadota bacterium]
MNGSFSLFAYNVRALFSGIYAPLCSSIPADIAAYLFLLDVVIAMPYVFLCFALFRAWRFFFWLKKLGRLVLIYALFILLCGATHLTGLLLELGAFLALDLIVMSVCAFVSVAAAVLTLAWWRDIRDALMVVGQAFEKVAIQQRGSP